MSEAQETSNHSKAVLRCLIDEYKEQLLIEISDKPLQEQLHKIYEAIQSQWNFSSQQVTIQINNISIAPNEANKLQQILSQTPTDKAIFNIVKIKPPKEEKKSQESKQTDFYVVKIHFNEQTLTTKLSKMTSKWDSDLFTNFKNGIKQHLEINENIYIYSQNENKDKKIAINNINNLKNAINPLRKDDDNYFLNLFVSDKKAEEKAVDAKEKGNKMDTCFKAETNEIIGYYRQTVKKIIQKTRIEFAINKISDSQSLNFGITCLNMVRPDTEKEINDDILLQEKILFWQRYCHFSLIQFIILKCINIRTQIIRELYQTNNFNQAEQFEPPYKKIISFIPKYHKLHENDPDLSFDKLNIAISEINIKVNDDMLPSQSDNKIKLKISKQSGNEIISIKKGINILKKQIVKKHRCYLLSPYESTTNYLSFPELSSEQFEMHFVDQKNKNKHLLYLDVEIPWNALQEKSLFVQFRILTERGFITVSSKNKLLKRYSGFYWIEDDRNNLKKAWSYFAKTVFNVQQEIDAMNVRSALIIIAFSAQLFTS